MPRSAVTLDASIVSNYYKSINWSPSTGLNNIHILNPQFQSPNAGIYTYHLTVVDSNGCISNDSVQITVLGKGKITSTMADILDFGDLGQCKSSNDTTFYITNTGDADVTFTSQSISTYFSIVEPNTPFTIKKGDSILIKINFSPTVAASVTGQLNFAGGKCGESYNWNLKGSKSKVLVSSSPGAIFMGNLIDCNTAAIDSIFTVNNSGADNAILRISQVKINSPFFIC